MRPGEAFYGPPLAVPIDGGGRAYEHPETHELLVSITTVLDAVPKPALEGWAARETARAAYELRNALMRLPDPEAAVDMLKNARYRSMHRAGKRGTIVHRILEALATDAHLPEMPANVAPYVEAGLAFVEDYRPTFTYTEATVFSDAGGGYAGTLDFLCEIDGLTILGDWKTGSGVYGEAALQLAAAKYADTLWNPDTGDLEQMPEVAGCIVVHLQRDGYRVVEIRAGEAAFAAFLAARALWPWACGKGDKQAIGPTLSPSRLVRTFGAEVKA